ncbi:MAG: hypothetical protein P9L88_04685 [Candidatus Tantalella remota]|nr:hypothetical protein [Candidatus Tantalella remota]
MNNELLDKLKKMEDINDHRGEIVIPRVMGLAYSKEKSQVGIFCYHVPSGKLIYSEEATSHFDGKIFSEVKVNDGGWGRGYVFLYEDQGYVLIQIADRLGEKIPGTIVANIVEKISQLSTVEIVGIVDEEGRDFK